MPPDSEIGREDAAPEEKRRRSGGGEEAVAPAGLGVLKLGGG